ncbi:hypothetical protein D1872_215420 [compost metagenome]
MHADIDQRTAAGPFLVRKPAAGVAQPPDEARLGKVDLPEIPGIDKLLQHGDVGGVAAHIADLEQLSRFADGLLDPEGFLHRLAQRFFAKHVLARLERRNADFRVRIVPGANAYGLDFRVGEQFPVIGVYVRDVVFGGGFPRPVLLQVADGDKLRLGVGQISLQMGFRNRSVADQAYFQFAHCDRLHPFFTYASLLQ